MKSGMLYFLFVIWVISPGGEVRPLEGLTEGGWTSAFRSEAAAWVSIKQDQALQSGKYGRPT